MKLKILLCVISFTGLLHGKAQNKNCNLRIVTEKISDSKTAYSPVVSVSVGAQTVALNFYRSGRAIVFAALVSGGDLFCVDYTSSFLFHFSDNTTLAFRASNAGNCTGSMQGMINEQLTDVDMQNFATKTIVSVDLIAKQQQIDVKLNANEANNIRTSFGCIKLAVL